MLQVLRHGGMRLPCVAVCCSVLQCVAACCSVLQWHFVMEWSRKQNNRCRKCHDTEFCAKCLHTPYHLGYTCEEYVSYQAARKCRFCDCKIALSNPAIMKPEYVRKSKKLQQVIQRGCITWLFVRHSWRISLSVSHYCWCINCECITVGASVLVHHCWCLTLGASFLVYHITVGASLWVHCWCLSLGASFLVYHITTVFTIVALLGASFLVYHITVGAILWVHHWWCITLGASLLVHHLSASHHS